MPAKKRLELGLKISDADHIQSQLLELLDDSVPPITPTEFARTCGEATTNVLSTTLESRDNQANLVRTDLQETQTPLANQPLLFKTGIPLTPEELLLYSSVKICFPINTFRLHSFEKYEGVIDVLKVCCGFTVTSRAISNYFYRSSNNIIRGLGKEKGKLRWKFFKKNIDNVISSVSGAVQNLLNGIVNDCDIQSVLRCLKNECDDANKAKPNKDDLSIDISDLESFEVLKEYNDWQVEINEDLKLTYLYFFKNSKGFAEISVILNERKEWSLLFEGKPCDTILEWSDVPPKIRTLGDLKLLVNTITKSKSCEAITYEKYKDLVSSFNEPIFKTKSGEAAAYAETLISKFQQKIIQSTKCSLLLPYDEVVPCMNVCDMCKKTEHYLTTLKSKHSQQDTNQPLSKFTRLDYLSSEDLLNYARNSARKLRTLKMRISRLEKAKAKMQQVGSLSDTDLRYMFDKLQNGVERNSFKLENPVCHWKGCELGKFTDVECLFEHVKKHFPNSQEDTAPINRSYSCEWKDCSKTYSKKRLLEQHVKSHTGDIKDEFLRCS